MTKLFGIFSIKRIIRRKIRKEVKRAFSRPKSTYNPSPQTPNLSNQTTVKSETPVVDTQPFSGKCYVIDGDTIAIRRTKIRIAGINAPELDQPYGRKSKWGMVTICKGQIISVYPTGETTYDRIVATCYLPDGRDIGAELIKQGLALDLPKFSGGKYQNLETEEARRKLTRRPYR